MKTARSGCAAGVALANGWRRCQWNDRHKGIRMDKVLSYAAIVALLVAHPSIGETGRTSAEPLSVRVAMDGSLAFDGGTLGIAAFRPGWAACRLTADWTDFSAERAFGVAFGLSLLLYKDKASE